MVAGFHPLGQASPKSDQGEPTPALKSTAILRPEKMHPGAGGERLLGGHGPIPQERRRPPQLRDRQSRIGGRKDQAVHKDDSGNHQRLNQAPDHSGQNSQQQPSAVRTRHLPKPAQESNHVLGGNMPSRRQRGEQIVSRCGGLCRLSGESCCYSSPPHKCCRRCPLRYLPVRETGFYVGSARALVRSNIRG